MSAPQKGFYDDPQNVHEYARMAEGHDGKMAIAELAKHLPADASVLELGMGPGTDMDMLLKRYRVTGSDLSQIFLDRYRERNPGAALLRLDAVALETDLRFDAIYSNKVLHHLLPDELRASLKRQEALLNSGGIACHSFWADSESRLDEYLGLKFQYYSAKDLRQILGERFDTALLRSYGELEADDSLLAILKRRAQ